MDPEVAERARGVFDALAVRGRPFEDIQASDFADWRMFFRFVKDASADPTTALGELNATSFLGKHDISVSAWGKSVKERSPLFKEEFDKFMRIERVREALAADLGVETPPRGVEANHENVAAGDPSPPSVSNDASHPAVPAVPSSTPPRRVASSPRGAAASNGDGDAAFGDGANETRFRNADISAGGDGSAVETAETHSHIITSEFHRERVLAYLDGFKTLLVDLRQKVDEIATANVLTVGGAVERADARLETALARVDAMVQEETNAFRSR